MKLIEIFEPYSREVSSDTIHEPRSAEKSKNLLGSGLFSDVVKSKNDPHVVYKTNKRPESKHIDDPFPLYAEIVMRDRLWDMVHFPRIYKSLATKDGLDTKMFEWTMEKLYPIQSLNSRELVYLCEKYFDKDIDHKRKSDLVYVLTGDIADATELERYEKRITDDTLKAACKKLISVKNEIQTTHRCRITWDVSIDNIMIRRTNTGVDVVFSDPFA